MTVQALEQKVRVFSARNNLLPPDIPLFVGFSGGADSTALLLLLKALAGDRLEAVHLHHGLRGVEADADEAWCCAFCEERGIPFRSDRLWVPERMEPGESPEMAARRLRLAWWRANASDRRVALGHHRDDALETMLLRFCRGCTSTGLTGLRPRAVVDNVTLVRPILCLTRMEIERYLRSSGVNNWREDNTNQDATIRRNRVRHELVPLLQELAGGRRALYRTLELLEQEADFLDAAANPVPLDPLMPETLRNLAPALLPRVLHRWLGRQLGRSATMTEAAALRLLSALNRPQDWPLRIDLDGEIFLRLSSQGLQVEGKSALRLARTITWDWRTQPELPLPELGMCLRAGQEGSAPGPSTVASERFDVLGLPCPLVIRPRRTGDHMVPFGSTVAHSIKKLIGNRHLTSRQKQRLILICDSTDRILWMPEVRRAECGRLTPDTKAWIALHWELMKPEPESSSANE